MKETPRTIPDTRVPCGVGPCVELREPWRIACQRHIAMLPPGVYRLLSCDSSSSVQKHVTDRGWEMARKIWRGEDISPEEKPIVILEPIHPSFYRSNPKSAARRISPERKDPA